MRVDSGSLFCPSLSFSPSSSISLLLARQKKVGWFICSCNFGYLSSISGVWKTSFVISAVSLWCNLLCNWMPTLSHTLSAGYLAGIEFPSQALFKTPKRMPPFVINNNYREVLKPLFWVLWGFWFCFVLVFFFFPLAFQYSHSQMYSFCSIPLHRCREQAQYTGWVRSL